jgi:hypothetical protein
MAASVAHCATTFCRKCGHWPSRIVSITRVDGLKRELTPRLRWSRDRDRIDNACFDHRHLARIDGYTRKILSNPRDCFWRSRDHAGKLDATCRHDEGSVEMPPPCSISYKSNPHVGPFSRRSLVIS